MDKAVGQETIAPTEEDYSKTLDRAVEGDVLRQFVSFIVAGEEFAFEAADAVEVLRPMKVTEVPMVPPFIKGIISVRGEMVMVVDLGKRLGKVESSEESGDWLQRMLVAGQDGARAGLLVDRLSGVKGFSLSSIEEAGPDAMPFVKGFISLDGRRIKILDLERLLEVGRER